MPPASQGDALLGQAVIISAGLTGPGLSHKRVTQAPGHEGHEAGVRNLARCGVQVPKSLITTYSYIIYYDRVWSWTPHCLFGVNHTYISDGEYLVLMDVARVRHIGKGAVRPVAAGHEST